ncbi:hypothetical protein A245_23309, partial [Pseudomonas syringae pv. actinidiae ICMP 19096]
MIADSISFHCAGRVRVLTGRIRFAAALIVALGFAVGAVLAVVHALAVAKATAVAHAAAVAAQATGAVHA